METLDRYSELLKELRDHLARFEDRRWPPLLGAWLRELERSERQQDVVKTGVDHLRRTQRALGGMGSIGDVVICPEAGHAIANDENEIRNANDRLLELVMAIDREISALLSGLEP